MSASRVAERFRANSRGFATRYRVLLLLFIVALLCDAISTTWFMLHEGGPHSEAHPVVRYVSHAVGPILGPWFGALGKFTAAVVVAIYLRRWATLILLVGSVLSLWAAWYNIWGVNLYTPVLLRLLPW